jgi:MYXO-CTERM domain-containing protein
MAHMKRPFAILACLVAPLVMSAEASADEIIPLKGDVPSGEPLHMLVPFEVPDGIVEIEVRHDDLSNANILDWGLYDPSGAFRGYGGGNTEPAIVGLDHASRSYLTGPVPAGTWKVHIGKAKILEMPARYQIEVHLRNAPTLPPQPERTPYKPSAALQKGPRWYAGDFHVHSRESGDAQPSLDEIAAFARSRGLDFVELSEHNTISQLDFMVDAQSRQKELLFIPGVEWTSYRGHANGIGAVSWVDHKTGFEGATVDKAIQAFEQQNALFAINHPSIALGDLCIGCAWEHDVPPEKVSALEIINGSAELFTSTAIVFWESLCEKGAHVAAIGGSDDHRAGMNQSGMNHSIGEPTTMVYAEELSVAAILAGIKSGRTVVRARPDSPMVELSASVAPNGDTIVADSVTLKAKVTGAMGGTVRFVHGGMRLPGVEVTSDSFETGLDIKAPASGEDRYRVEILLQNQLQTITSHLWVKADPASQSASSGGGAASSAGGPPDDAAGGCGCSMIDATGSAWLLPLFSLAAAAWLRRR